MPKAAGEGERWPKVGNARPPGPPCHSFSCRPPAFKRTERIYHAHAPTLLGASGLGQGPGNLCHEAIGGTREARSAGSSRCSTRASQAAACLVDLKVAGDSETRA